MMDLGFIQIHSLSSRFQGSEKTTAALEALELMESCRALHPMAPQMMAHLRAESHPKSAYYSAGWARTIEQNPPDDTFFSDGAESFDKNEMFDHLWPLFRAHFVRSDFAAISALLATVECTVQFSNHAADHNSFVGNRLFEFLLLQTLAHVYQIWFSTSEESPLAAIEKRCDHYFARSTWLFKSLEEKPALLAAAVLSEFDCAYLLRWYICLACFRQGAFSEFLARFESLEPHWNILEKVHMQREAHTLHQLACVACRPFQLHSTTTSMGTSQFSGGLDVLSLYMDQLAVADFAAAKKTCRDLAVVLSDFSNYLLPRPSDKFWTAFSGLIDAKAFLLIMSVTRAIPRKKLLARLGTEDNLVKMSNRLVLLVSVLQLGQLGIGYDPERDIFYREPVSQQTKIQQLSVNLDEAEHLLEVESASKLFTSMVLQAHISQK